MCLFDRLDPAGRLIALDCFFDKLVCGALVFFDCLDSVALDLSWLLGSRCAGFVLIVWIVLCWICFDCLDRVALFLVVWIALFF